MHDFLLRKLRNIHQNWQLRLYQWWHTATLVFLLSAAQKDNRKSAVLCCLVSILTIPCSLFTLQSVHYFQQPPAHFTDFTPASEVKKRISDSIYALSGSPSLSAQGFTPYANSGCLTGVKVEEKIEMYTAHLRCHGNVRSRESERENPVNLRAEISSTDRIKRNSIMAE